ncbi:S8 family serine peptidase [Dyella sp.]|jgi:outer membrane autotransporter protein|uniref:S8 family serine peptidase n=1 Tax=Dyella sp. TaxID=1869338 RepID=UPI002D78638A|nr:S8 family serine peptidase [Dyella sp.]HET6431239.1 S8 family serine peptidase [Dyella sp.]
MSKQGLTLMQRRMPLVIAAALGLAGCGGGGGNVRSPAPPPAPPPPAPTDQPAIDAHLTVTNANAAHAAGFTGAGVTIGIVDTGINPDHPALKGRVKALLLYVDPAKNDTTKGDVVGHGTWTSQIAAGKPFGQWPGGIAPDAELVSARIISDTPPKDDGSGQGNKVEPADADFFGQYLLPDLINNGVEIMNNSWGGLYFDPSNAAQVGTAFGDAFRPFVVDHDGLVVFATGNEGQAQPSDTAAIPYYAPDLERGWLAVAAYDSINPEKQQLASYSNACGKAMNYCLVAPGDVVITGADDTAGNPTYYVVQGTSFSTPAVAGAAADVWQAFPYFNNDLVRQTLLGTAKDLGTPGVDATFGYGLLDVGKAVKGPAQFNWGNVTVNFTGESSWDNPISGAGSLIKQGTGTLSLSQPSSYTGTTQVQGGGLIADSLAGSVTIAANAGFGANHVGGNITNAGTLDLGNAGGTTLDGKYVQQVGGRLALSLGSILTVSGKATINGGDLYVYDKNSNYTVNSHTDVLDAAGGLTGTFSALTTPTNVLLTATLNYDATSAWLNVQQVNVTQVSGTSYTAASFGAAQRVQGAFEQLNSALGSGAAPSGQFLAGAASLQHVASTEALQQSLQSLSGQLHAASAAMTFEAIDAGTRALSDHVDQLLDAPQPSAWSQNLGYHGSMSRAGYGNVGVDLSGWMTGADRRLGANGFAGYAISQADGLGRLAESADQGRSHAMEAMLYGGVVKNAWYAVGRFGAGHYRETMRRAVQLGSFGSGVASNTNGRYGVAYGESGYRFGVGGMHLTPYANLQYAQIRRDAFSETGGSGFGLKTPSQTIARWQAGVGLRASQGWTLGNGSRLEWTGHLQWQRAFGLRGDVFEASFTGVDQWAPVGGIGVARYGGVVGTGLDWTLSERSSLALGVDQYLGQRDRARMATASYRLAF